MGVQSTTASTTSSSSSRRVVIRTPSSPCRMHSRRQPSRVRLHTAVTVQRPAWARKPSTCRSAMATVVPAPTIPIRIPIRPLLFSASLHHSTERDVCKAVSAQAEQAAQVDALGLEGGQVEHAAEQQAG